MEYVQSRRQRLLQLTAQIRTDKIFDRYADQNKAAVGLAIKKALKWAERKIGADLPEEAWQAENFAMDRMTDVVQAVTIKTDDLLYWTLQYRHPCQQEIGRVWNTEISVVQKNGQKPRACHQLVSA